MVNIYFKGELFLSVVEFFKFRKQVTEFDSLLYMVCLPSLMTMLSYLIVLFGYGQLLIDLIFYYQNEC